MPVTLQFGLPGESGGDYQPLDAHRTASFSMHSLTAVWSMPSRLAGVPLQRFRRNDMDSLRHELSVGAPANRTLIISDGVFSMDGDICPLA